MQVGRLIGIIGACAALQLPATAAEVEPDILEDEFAFLQEEEVVFSAAKHQQKAGFSPSAVIVITSRDIRESGAVTLTELLRRYPAVHVYMFDPLYPTAEVRGSYKVVVLVDGREVNLDLFTSPFYSLMPVNLRDIERIEIVLGPNSALYGANAVSALIDITTRPPRTGWHADVYLAGGEHAATVFEGVLEGGTGPLAAKGYFGSDRHASWMDRGLLSKDVTRAGGTLSLGLKDARLTLNGGMIFGAGRIYALMGYMDTHEFLLAHAQTQLEWGAFKARAYWYGVWVRFDLDLGLVHPDMGVELGTLPTFDLQGNTVQLEAQYDLEPFTGNLLIAGADFRLINYHADVLVDPRIGEYRIGGFLHDEHRFGKRLRATVGVRFDWNSETEPAISPRVAVVYNPAGEHFLRLSGGTAFRKPSLMETSANFRINANPAFPEVKDLFEKKGISNPDLGNEVLTAVEIGYRGAFLDKALRLSADFYAGFSRDSIDFVSHVQFDQTPLGPRINLDESRVGYDNVGRDTDVYGVTVFFEAEPDEDLTLFARGEFRYRWLVEEQKRDDLISALLASAGGTLRCAFGLIVHLAFVFISERSDSIRDPVSILGPVTIGTVPARLYALGGLTYTLDLDPGGLDLGLTFFNPFGGRFREEMGVRLPAGGNFGGELIGTRVMLTAGFRY